MHPIEITLLKRTNFKLSLAILVPCSVRKIVDEMMVGKVL